MSQPPAGVENAVRELLVVSRALVAVAARSLAEADDVTLPQFRALVVLSARRVTTVSDLAAALDIHPSTATRLTDRLVRKRLIRRTELAEDRRVTQLHVTASGYELVQRVTDRRLRDLTDIAQRIPAEHWPEIADALAAFAAAAGEAGGVDVFGWNTAPR